MALCGESKGQLPVAEEARMEDRGSKIEKTAQLSFDPQSSILDPRSSWARDLADLLQLVDQLIQQTRTLTFDLYPAMLDDLGLVPTLKWYRNQYHEQTGIKVEIAEFGQPGVLPTPVVTYLFRAMKELLHNVAKHAQAKEAVLSVYWQRQRMRLTSLLPRFLKSPSSDVRTWANRASSIPWSAPSSPAPAPLPDARAALTSSKSAGRESRVPS